MLVEWSLNTLKVCPGGGGGEMVPNTVTLISKEVLLLISDGEFKTFTLGGIWGFVTQYVNPVTITISAVTVGAIWLLSQSKKSHPKDKVGDELQFLPLSKNRVKTSFESFLFSSECITHHHEVGISGGFARLCLHFRELSLQLEKKMRTM